MGDGLKNSPSCGGSHAVCRIGCPPRRAGLRSSQRRMRPAGGMPPKFRRRGLSAYQTNWQTIQVGNKWWGLSPSRLYDFETGRFTQRDPMYGMPFYNAFANTPIIIADPDGWRNVSVDARTLMMATDADWGWRVVQGGVDFVRGAGDTLSFGFSAWARNKIWGERGQVYNQGAYVGGAVTGVAMQTYMTGGLAGAARAGTPILGLSRGALRGYQGMQLAMAANSGSNIGQGINRLGCDALGGVGQIFVGTVGLAGNLTMGATYADLSGGTPGRLVNWWNKGAENDANALARGLWNVFKDEPRKTTALNWNETWSELEKIAASKSSWPIHFLTIWRTTLKFGPTIGVRYGAPPIFIFGGNVGQVLQQD